MSNNIESTITFLERVGDEAFFKIEKGLFAGVKYSIKESTSDSKESNIEYTIFHSDVFEDICRKIIESIILNDIEARFSELNQGQDEEIDKE